MGLIRMFHYSCDNAPNGGYDCADSTGDEWYAATARQLALQDGWHIRKQLAICPACWEAGIRFTGLAE